MTSKRPCSVEGCSQNGPYAGPMCSTHYRRMQRLGTTTVRTREEVFWSRVEESATGCWRWTTTCDSYGYGVFSVDGINRKAHRIAYELLVGEIPDGLELDHLCRVRRCVNPWHLDPVTTAVNVARGTGPSAVNAARTVCVNGHELDEANTYRRPNGNRACVACARQRQRVA